MKLLRLSLLISTLGGYEVNALNSHWKIKNQSTSSARVECYKKSGIFNIAILYISYLGSGATQSMQFDQAYDNGKGYPEQGVLIYCNAKATAGFLFDFTTIGSGDNVEMQIEDDLIRLKRSTSREPIRTRFEVFSKVRN